MAESSFASLGPTLLARKGGAKPAMRRQVATLAEMAGGNANDDMMSAPSAGAPNLEDLGWNDMGEDGSTVEASSSVLALTPAAAPDQSDEPEGDGTPEADARAQQEALKQAVAPEPARKSKPAPVPVPAANGKRAAFTLRLDPQRHLRLKLAATLEGVSAQRLLTRALDAALAELPEIEPLAAKIERNKAGER